MAGLRRGPRVYQIFISHRYDDDDIYSALRRHLIEARNFSFKNLSIQVDQTFGTATPSATKRRLSGIIRNADVLLVFAHSGGEMVEHELDRAEHYGVPVISIVDPNRVEAKYRHARSRRIEKVAKREVPLDQPELIIEAVRTIARSQRIEAQTAMQGETIDVLTADDQINTPKDIAQRIGESVRPRGIIGRIGAFLFGHASASGRNKFE